MNNPFAVTLPLLEDFGNLGSLDHGEGFHGYSILWLRGIVQRTEQFVILDGAPAVIVQCIPDRFDRIRRKWKFRIIAVCCITEGKTAGLIQVIPFNPRSSSKCVYILFYSNLY